MSFLLSCMCWSYFSFYYVLLLCSKNLFCNLQIGRIEKYSLKMNLFFWNIKLFWPSSPIRQLSSPRSANYPPHDFGCTWKLPPHRQTQSGWVGQWRRAKPCRVFVCRAIIKVLPGLLLLHHHVWSPPRVLEVPLERVGQDLCHLCRSCERKLPHMTVSSEEVNV